MSANPTGQRVDPQCINDGFHDPTEQPRLVLHFLVSLLILVNRDFAEHVKAGLGAGATEAVAVVTPMEVIKIRLQAQQRESIPSELLIDV